MNTPKTGVIFSVCAFAACAAFGTTFSTATKSLSITFAGGKERGRIVSMKGFEGQDFVSSRNCGDFPIWKIEMCRCGQFMAKAHVTALQAKKYEVREEGDRLVLTWEDAGECLAKAEAVFRAEASDDSIRCRLTVTPKAGWAVVSSEFPSFAMNECLGDSPADDAIVMGTGHGGVARYPMDPRREYWRGRHLGKSPGSLAAQFGSFYDERGGLYTAAEDAEGNEKSLLMDRWYRADTKNADGLYDGGEFFFRWTRDEYSEGPDAQPYDIVLKAFRGEKGQPTTWYDAADIYKKWAKNQFWCRKTFLEKTDFLPAWTRDAPVVMRFNREWFDQPEKMKAWLEGYWKQKFAGVPMVAILEGWEHHGDWITTEYFPIYPSEEKFAEIAGWIKQAGGHIWPWPGGHHWNVQVGKKGDGTFRLDFSKDFWERVAPHAICGQNGKVFLTKLGWLGGGTSASICTADKWGVDWWNRDVSCELVKRGAELVQADQDVGAGVPVCWSKEHGHKPGPGKWRMASQRHQFETMIEEMRKLNPDALFSFEEMHEYFNDIYCFCDYRNCRWGGAEWASVWNYLYHEYVPPFQSGYEQHTKWDWMVFCAVDGQMPRLPMSLAWYGEKATAEMRQMCAFVERWTALYRGAGRKFLAHGRELRPPRVECDWLPYRGNFRGNKIEGVKPTVYGSAWEAADGSRALMLGNISASNRRITVTWEGKAVDLTVKPHDLVFLPAADFAAAARK